MHSAISGCGKGKLGENSTLTGMTKTKKKGTPGGLSNMVSAMIPGAKIDNKGRVLVNVGTSQETIHFNIGGVNFETYRSTLFRLPNSPLANEKFLAEHYRPDRKDYFFDRDPDIFRATLNYLRTGELHIPSYICGPAAKTELQFWGVEPNHIERCCWTNYNDWNSTLDALNQLEHDRKSTMMSMVPNPNTKQTWWTNHQPYVWNFLSRPDFNMGAKIYGIIALAFVILSIFSFCAATTPLFSPRVETIKTSAATNQTNSGNDITMTSATTAANNVTMTSGLKRNTTAADGDFKTIIHKHPLLIAIDIVCLVFFTIEYIIRVIFAPRKLKFMTSLMGVIDLVAILPDYIEMIVHALIEADPNTIDFIMIFRIVRVLRIFRLISHVPGLWILIYTLKASIGELVLLVCFMAVGILLFSSIIYFVEDRDTIPGIPDGFWWAIITMTTVGYGDMYPKSILGKCVGSLCALSGLLMIGFSVPALVNNFMLYYKHMQFALQAEKEGGSKPKLDMDKSIEQRPYHTNVSLRNGNHSSTHASNHAETDPERIPMVTVHSLTDDAE